MEVCESLRPVGRASQHVLLTFQEVLQTDCFTGKVNRICSVAHAMNASEQETGCSFWFHRLNDVLVSEVNLIHQPSLACHFTQFSHVRQLSLLNIHLPTWHCPGLSSPPSHSNPVFCLVVSARIGLQTLSLVGSLGFWFYWRVVGDRTPQLSPCGLYTQSAYPYTFPTNVCLLALDTF